MREIKFRAWDTIDHEFVYGEPLYGFFASVGSEEEKIEKFYKRYKVSEFTGLKDKNGTKEYPKGQEIYEGDILSNMISNFVVKYNLKKGAYMCGLNFLAHIVDGKNFEVIGNIYENPELLKRGLKHERN